MPAGKRRVKDSVDTGDSKRLGGEADYRTAKMPPVNTGLMEGESAWRQHDGGHEDRSNLKYFIAWANKLIKHQPKAGGQTD